MLMDCNVKDSFVRLRKSCKSKDIKSYSYDNINAAREAYKDLNLTEVDLQMMVVPNSEAAEDAYMWLSSFIELVGDSAPNRNAKIQIPGIYTKQSIHDIFTNHMRNVYSSNEYDPLELSAFKNLWKNVFPNVTISKFCQVSGKCYTCHSIYERQEVFKTSAELGDIRKLATYHKLLIEMQRYAYLKNRQLAQEQPDLYMSLIIDGMAQDHCQLPWLANKAQDGVLKQKIFGAKQHGIARSFYRTYPHVRSGANLACEVILLEIERRMDYCLKNDKPFPKVFFLQTDGGCENTSKTVHALCESLVSNGVFDKIELARLPVGHTHEDIDALFGVLWRAMQGKTIISPQHWETIAKSAFTHLDISGDGKDHVADGYKESFDDEEEQTIEI